MSSFGILACGLVGGLIPDLLRFVKYKYKKDFPSYLRYPTFWIGLVVSLALGALTAWLLSATTPLQAIACGFSAPEILSRVLSKRATAVDRGPDEFDLRKWWAE